MDKGKSRKAKRVKIDKQHFEDYCSIMCTEEEIAYLFHCSIDTVADWCKKTYGKTFAEVYEEFRAFGKMSVRRAQRRMAEGNVAMAIFWGKNYLKQSDDPRKYERETTTEDKIDRFLDVLTDAMNSGDDGDDGKSGT